MVKSKSGKRVKKPVAEKPEDLLTSEPESLGEVTYPETESDPPDVLDAVTPEDTPEPTEKMEPALPIPAPVPESPPEPSLPRIHFRVFEKVAGAKWDQLAGFRSHAKSNNLGPMTIPEWREAFQAYKNKPTG